MFHAFGPVQTAPLFPTSTRLSINGISAINILAALTPGIIQSSPVGLQAAVLLSAAVPSHIGALGRMRCLGVQMGGASRCKMIRVIHSVMLTCHSIAAAIHNFLPGVIKYFVMALLNGARLPACASLRHG